MKKLYDRMSTNSVLQKDHTIECHIISGDATKRMGNAVWFLKIVSSLCLRDDGVVNSLTKQQFIFKLIFRIDGFSGSYYMICLYFAFNPDAVGAVTN